MAKDNIIRPDRFQGPTPPDGDDGNSLMKDYIDARDDAVESRLNGKLDRLATKGTIWAALATALGLVFAAWAIAGDRFDAGMAVSPQISAVQQNQAAVDARQDAQMNAMDAKLDVIIKQTKKP